MRKYVIFFLLVIIVLLSLTSCQGGMENRPDVKCDIVGDTLKEVSTDITIEIYNWEELVKVSGEDMPIYSISFRGTWYAYNETKSLEFNYHSYAYEIKELNHKNNIISAKIPPKSASGPISVHSKGLGSSNITKFLQIKYPQTLSLSSSKAKIGDEITITTTEPFFIEESFTKDKLLEYLLANYYIVWVESDLTEMDYFGVNFEKKPVEKEYYIVDSITPTSVTFKVPPYAKTGKVHVINEKGFCSYNYPYDEKYPNSPAYFSSAIDLEIIE